MLLKTEIQDTSQKALIVAPHDTLFLRKLKKKLKGMNLDVFSTSTSVPDYSKYDVCIFIQYPDVLLPSIKKMTDTKFIFILFNEYELAQTYASFAYQNKLQHIKILNLETNPSQYEKDIETIFWFSFSRTEDIFLHIFHQKPFTEGKKMKPVKRPFSYKEFFTPKKLVVLGLFFLVISQFLFVFPLIGSTFSTYAAYTEFVRGNKGQSQRHIEQADSMLDTSEKLYGFSKPILYFFSIALPFENLMQLNTAASTIIATSYELQEDAEIVSGGIFEKNKNDQDVGEIVEAKDRLNNNIPIIRDQIAVLEDKLPTWNPRLQESKEKLQKIDQSLALYEAIGPHFDSLLARDTEKKYLLLFANNMELRPGGGFIGSYAVVSVKHYTIGEIKVYDVYDADGQLTSHIAPPEPISKFLDQPFWYLRDSAFTGDFVENFNKAEEFLDIEVGETDFDGGLLLTTTAVKHILTTVDSLYIPDYQDTITAENFYLKAQLYAEEEFFPGSIQKKSFLSDVMDQMLLNLEDANMEALLSNIRESLNQKQLVLYSKDPGLQQVFEENYWSGRALSPNCTISGNVHCIADYVYQMDANLGVNKANFYISRPSELKVSIDSSGKIINTLAVTYSNDSNQGVFPGGTYKNYFQVLLPPNSFVQSVTLDGSPIDDYDETNFTYKTVGFLMTVAPQEKHRVEIIYRLPTTIIQGDGVYQLVFQKQIGSPNYDLKFSFDVPTNVSVTRHNLSPLAESNKILYNTSVSSDKIFLIEFSKN